MCFQVFPFNISCIDALCTQSNILHISGIETLSMKYRCFILITSSSDNLPRTLLHRPLHLCLSRILIPQYWQASDSGTNQAGDPRNRFFQVEKRFYPASDNNLPKNPRCRDITPPRQRKPAW